MFFYEKSSRFLALASAVLMSFSMAVPAFAAEPNTIERQEPVMEEVAYNDQGLLRSSQYVFTVGDAYVQIAYARPELIVRYMSQLSKMVIMVGRIR